jgi:glucosamine--fructose-6-phosphate aminotransferase (isomerizing)
MCGIIGTVGDKTVLSTLLTGLKKLEYRGYDSAGVAISDANGQFTVIKAVGNTDALKHATENSHAISGATMGIAHTRWATHGRVTEANAHPHISGRISLVHNGIIENHHTLRNELQSLGAQFLSETDSEVLAVAIEREMEKGVSLHQAVQVVTARATGAYGLVVMDRNKEEIVVARSGSPMVIGLSAQANYVASDPLAINDKTESFIYLDEGETAIVHAHSVNVFSARGEKIDKPISIVEYNPEDDGKNGYDTFMQKEIAEQPAVIGRLVRTHLSDQLGVLNMSSELNNIRLKLNREDCKNIHIVACGTSYHAGLVARYYFEHYLDLPTTVEIASEFRYRDVAVPEGTAFICISQSGETADTLAALRKAKKSGYLTTLVLCNVATSSMVREADASLALQAGIEVGVASTKAFTTQLTAFLLLTLAMMDSNDPKRRSLHNDLMRLPADCETMLNLGSFVDSKAAPVLDGSSSCLFLGRGEQTPIAMEGALKLKELSYIHAEAYAAGELKHGPLALIDKDIPIIVTAPSDGVVDKLTSNIEEVAARGGRFVIFHAPDVDIDVDNAVKIQMPVVPLSTAAITYVIPLQLLSYYATLRRDFNVDQPRNLAKSVTTE